MDSDFLAIIFVVIISAIAGWLQDLVKKKRESKQAYAPEQHVHTQEPVKPLKPLKPLKTLESLAETPTPFLISSEEGARVTADAKPQPKAKAAPAIAQPQSLRDAIIWGEILQRKF